MSNSNTVKRPPTLIPIERFNMQIQITKEVANRFD